MFLVAVFGLPYLMGKLIHALARSQEVEEAHRQQQLTASGHHLPPNQQQDASVIDPSKLDFCRVMYDYTPPLQSAAAGIDLQVKKGDLVAVLSRTDTMGNPSDWWRCRARDGSVGYLPGPYLETIQRRQPTGGNGQGRITAATAAGGSAPGSRTQTLKTISSKDEGRSKSLSSVGVGVDAVKEPELRHGTRDGGVESFQKSAFYS